MFRVVRSLRSGACNMLDCFTKPFSWGCESLESLPHRVVVRAKGWVRFGCDRCSCWCHWDGHMRGVCVCVYVFWKALVISLLAVSE